MLEIRILEAAQENPDRGDAAEDGGAGLGLRLAFVGLLVADMNVRIEDSRQHDPPGRVVDFRPRMRQIDTKHDDLALGHADVGLHSTNAGNHQCPVAHDQIERRCVSIIPRHSNHLGSTCNHRRPVLSQQLL